MGRSRRLASSLGLALFAVAVAAALAFGLRAVVKARCFALTGPILCRVETNERRVALSFDDGPTRRGVEAVLPVLDRFGVKATFFLIGSSTVRHPELASRIAAAGHEIGSHSYSHSHMIDVREAPSRDELERTDAAFEALDIPKPRWMRPPYGAKFIGLGNAVATNDQTMVLWDVEEPSVQDARAYADQLVGQVRPGSIILIHPMSSKNEIARTALPLVLEALQARGYDVVPVGELVDG